MQLIYTRIKKDSSAIVCKKYENISKEVKLLDRLVNNMQVKYADDFAYSDKIKEILADCNLTNIFKKLEYILETIMGDQKQSKMNFGRIVNFLYFVKLVAIG